MDVKEKEQISPLPTTRVSEKLYGPPHDFLYFADERPLDVCLHYPKSFYLTIQIPPSLVPLPELFLHLKLGSELLTL